MWNDEFPGGEPPEWAGGAHAKGVLGLGMASGFYLLHSVPKFPAAPCRNCPDGIGNGSYTGIALVSKPVSWQLSVLNRCLIQQQKAAAKSSSSSSKDQAAAAAAAAAEALVLNLHAAINGPCQAVVIFVFAWKLTDQLLQLAHDSPALSYPALPGLVPTATTQNQSLLWDCECCTIVSAKARNLGFEHNMNIAGNVHEKVQCMCPCFALPHPSMPCPAPCPLHAQLCTSV